LALRRKGEARCLFIPHGKGEIEVYNYLKEHGTAYFEPRQIAQKPGAPASRTNVYIQFG